MEKNSLALMLQEHKQEIMSLAPEYMNKNRMLSILLEAVKNPDIQKCTAVSVLAAAKDMAELGTEIVGIGGVWLVPFGRELTVIPDWRLIIDKAKRAKAITHATVEAVYEGDEFYYEKGMNPTLVHKPNLKGARKKEKLIAVYCIYTLIDGITKDFDVMNKEEIDAIKAISKAKSGPWIAHYVRMAEKSVARRAMRVFGGASELKKVIDIDNASTGLVLDIQDPIAEPKALPEEKVVDAEFFPEKVKEEAAPAEKKEPVKSPFKKKAKKPAKTESEPKGKEYPDQEERLSELVCSDCDKKISQAEYDWSMPRYKRQLCRACQNRISGKR